MVRLALNRKAMRSGGGNCRGSVMIQAALTLPLLIFLGAGMIQYSFLLVARIYAKQATVFAARAFTLEEFNPILDGENVTNAAKRLVTNNVETYFLKTTGDVNGTYNGLWVNCFADNPVACPDDESVLCCVGDCSTCVSQPGEISIIVTMTYQVPSIIGISIPGFSDQSQLTETTTMRYH